MPYPPVLGEKLKFRLIALKLHKWGALLKFHIFTGFYFFPSGLKAFMQWLSRVDILNSAVQAIICHTETQLDKMTD